MKYAIQLYFRDGTQHTIHTDTSIEKSREYLSQVAKAIDTGKSFRMLNDKDELIYVCNTINLLHAILITIK